MAHALHRGAYEKLDARRMASFVEAIRLTGSWSTAARYASAGFRATTASTFRSAARRDPLFAEQVREAFEAHRRDQEQLAERRALVQAQIACAATGR